MKTKLSRFLILVAGTCLFLSIPTASLADYTMSVSNGIRKTTNETGSSCSPVSVTCWSANGNGTKQQLPAPLGPYSPHTFSFRNTSCASLDITVSCHFFKTVYTNKGRMSETSHGSWADESKTQTCPGGSHKAEVGLTEGVSGNITYQTLSITCQ